MKTPANSANVADIVGLLEKIAPSRLSASWDNCGLQVGSPQWPVTKIWVALDPLISVLSDAARHGADMVVTHHPLILKPLKSIDPDTFVGKVIASALCNQTAIFSAHTNLDSASGGINDLFAQKIGLHKLRSLVPPQDKEVADGASSASEPVGIGRVGELIKPLPLKEWIGNIKDTFGLSHVRTAGNLDRMVGSGAVCSGSGGSLVEEFLKTDADVYVSGDLGYHAARAVEDEGRAFIDIGHFASEHIILNTLTDKLTDAVKDAGWEISVESCSIERDPFTTL